MGKSEKSVGANRHDKSSNKAASCKKHKDVGCTGIDAVEKIFLILGDIFSLVNSHIANWYKYCREKHSSILL